MSFSNALMYIYHVRFNDLITAPLLAIAQKGVDFILVLFGEKPSVTIMKLKSQLKHMVTGATLSHMRRVRAASEDTALGYLLRTRLSA
jgi:hypothetical protein